MAVKTGVEIELKAETGFRGFEGSKSALTRFLLSRKLPCFVGVNSKHQQEFFERDFETRRQAEQFVDAGD